MSGEEYLGAAKQTESLMRSTARVLEEAVDGTDTEVGSLRSGRCGEAYSETLRRLEINAHTSVERRVPSAQAVRRLSDPLERLGWRRTSTPGGATIYRHRIESGGKLTMDVAGFEDADRPGWWNVSVGVEGPCMRVPKDMVDRF